MSKCNLSAAKANYDLIRAMFPAGTTRGPYAGYVGCFSFNGNLDTSITIRTTLLKAGKAYVQAGGGWVNDSEAEAEFQGTVNKSKAMLRAVAFP
jgi:anthranilate synthase component 1